MNYKKINFYINYDLGLRGDYAGLYKWLDKNKAEERGYGYARIKDYEYPENLYDNTDENTEKNSKLIEHIKKELKSFVKLEPSDRIYLTMKGVGNKKIGGTFLFGGKRPAPWQGYYQKENSNTNKLE